VLASFPSPGQGVWYLGPVPIRAYALCIIAGIIAALVIGDRRWAARGGERGVIYDVALWAVPFGLIGGRLYHVLTDWKTYFGPDGAGLGAALRIWEGGLGIWGAIALGGVGAWIGCRRKGIPLPAFGDAVAPGIVLAQAIGRLGNYFNQELYGRETTVPWGLEIFYRRDSSGVVDVHSLDGVSTGEVAAVVHPTFLYELLWNLLVFVLLLWADRRFRLGHGRLFALYVAAYCVGRFWIELMRDDAATEIAGIRINVFTATLVFIGAVVYMLLAPKGRENPVSLRGKQPAEIGEESLVEEWAGDLVAAAKGSGIIAAATVAGEHDAEDAVAVGDVESDDVAEIVVESDDVAEIVVESDDVAEIVVESDDVAEIVVESDDVAEIVVAETQDETLDEVPHEAVAVEEIAVETDAEADEAEGDVEIVYFDRDTEGEAVDAEAEFAADTDDTAAVVVYESEHSGADLPDVVLEPEPVVDVAEPESEWVPDPEAEVEAEDGRERKSEAVAEPQPEPDGDESAKLKGSTLKRLLWGAGSRGD
jgi:prolipoprotein diacylglyceryl transferase